MKKINLAIVCMAVAAMTSCCGSVSAPKVSMNDETDTLSYSLGYGRAVHIYKDQLPADVVDSTTLKSFLKGFIDASKNTEDMDKLAYALGFEIGNQEMAQAVKGLSSQIFGEEESLNSKNYLAGFIHGMTDVDKFMTFEEADETANRLYSYLMTKRGEENKAENEAFLEQKALEEGIIKTESGLLYEVLSKGEGTVYPTESSDVEVMYHGELIDGTMFDESTEPVSFNLGGVIKGFSEGIQLMNEGDKFRFYIPSSLGYGAQNAGDIKPYSTLIFDVELIKID
ncbi:MAG: FKBP-type peptidyl-prolyl cis-trans isomerase [Bacteroidaceae bacterium]|nr:FKBP-type peptidyl-prolyl cis-trans isomerase [Bacteroidaceae bacterium]